MRTKPLKIDKADLLFLLGGALVVAGVALLRGPAPALITAGGLLLAVPVLELVSGFILGLIRGSRS